MSSISAARLVSDKANSFWKARDTGEATCKTIFVTSSLVSLALCRQVMWQRRSLARVEMSPSDDGFIIESHASNWVQNLRSGCVDARMRDAYMRGGMVESVSIPAHVREVDEEKDGPTQIKEVDIWEHR